MKNAGAPKGNSNATKNKAWTDALRRELTGSKNADKLAKIAGTVAQLALDGDMKAVKEIGDRLDGKPVQAIEGTGSDGEFIIKITQDDETVL